MCASISFPLAISWVRTFAIVILEKNETEGESTPRSFQLGRFEKKSYAPPGRMTPSGKPAISQSCQIDSRKENLALVRTRTANPQNVDKCVRPALETFSFITANILAGQPRKWKRFSKNRGLFREFFASNQSVCGGLACRRGGVAAEISPRKTATPGPTRAMVPEYPRS